MYCLRVARYPTYNSLTILLPYEIAEDLNLEEGDVVALIKMGDETVVRKVKIEVKGEVPEENVPILKRKKRVRYLPSSKSYTVALPKEWVERYKPDYVYICEQSGVVVIIPEKLKNKIEEIRIKLAPLK